MALYIKIDLEGVPTLIRRVNGVKGKVKDLRKAWKKIGEDFRKTEERVFNGQGYYGSRPGWTPLTPKYREWKDKHYPGKPILQQTGALKSSLTKKGAGHIEIIRRTSITLGSNDPKFKWHQKGTKKMVARPPITFTNYQAEKWAKIIRDDILEGAKK